MTVALSMRFLTSNTQPARQGDSSPLGAFCVCRVCGAFEVGTGID